MTEGFGAPEPPQVQPSDDGGQGDAGQGQYAGYLRGVPEQFHGQLLDGFKKTDSYWQGKVNELSQAQSQFAPYQPLAGKYDAAYLQAAAAMLDEIQSNPKEVLPWLAGQMNVEFGQQAATSPPVMPQQQGQQQWGQDQDWTQNLPPQLLEKLNQIDQLPQIAQLAELAGRSVLQQQEAQRKAEELAHFDQLLGGLAKKYGEFDEDWVLAKIESGRQPEEAVKAYHEWYGQQMAKMQGRNAPRILGAGGGMPSSQTDVTSLNQQQTKDLVAQMVAAANRDG